MKSSINSNLFVCLIKNKIVDLLNLNYGEYLFLCVFFVSILYV